jgi:hypothetical protein
MKNIIFVLLLVFHSFNCVSQNYADSVKKGWIKSPVPAAAFDSDLGLLYGIVLTAIDYKDGSRYPDYLQTYRLQLAGYTKGSSDLYLDYDSFTLITGKRFLAGIRYVGNLAYPFYGFNGSAANYNKRWEKDKDSEYKSRMFFRQDRKVFQVYANLLDTIAQSKFQWHAGWSFGNYKIDTVNITRINRKLNAGRKLPHIPTLYELYSDWGVIRESEKEGGMVNSLLLGLIYDSRSSLSNPQSGIFTELNFRWMPSILNTNNFSGLNVGLIHRQYLSLIRNRLTFDYRIWVNANLGGNQSYFTRQLMTTFLSTEGYGGAGTIRGILLNRIVTSDFVFGNFEFRSRLLNFRFIKQTWYLGTTLFMDAGRILKPISLNLSNVPATALNEYFGQADRTIHKTVGAGLKIVENENFVISAEYARTFDPQDGFSGLYIGLDYLF